MLGLLIREVERVEGFWSDLGLACLSLRREGGFVSRLLCFGGIGWREIETT